MESKYSGKDCSMRHERSQLLSPQSPPSPPFHSHPDQYLKLLPAPCTLAWHNEWYPFSICWLCCCQESFVFIKTLMLVLCSVLWGAKHILGEVYLGFMCYSGCPFLSPSPTPTLLHLFYIFSSLIFIHFLSSSSLTLQVYHS